MADLPSLAILELILVACTGPQFFFSFQAMGGISYLVFDLDEYAAETLAG
jgi:hypothetical protein